MSKDASRRAADTLLLCRQGGKTALPDLSLRGQAVDKRYHDRDSAKAPPLTMRERVRRAAQVHGLQVGSESKTKDVARALYESVVGEDVGALFAEEGATLPPLHAMMRAVERDLGIEVVGTAAPRAA